MIARTTHEQVVTHRKWYCPPYGKPARIAGRVTWDPTGKFNGNEPDTASWGRLMKYKQFMPF
jgi:hypothetical protein